MNAFSLFLTNDLIYFVRLDWEREGAGDPIKIDSLQEISRFYVELGCCIIQMSIGVNMCKKRRKLDVNVYAFKTLFSVVNY